MSIDGSARESAVAGLVRSDPHSPGITRERAGPGFRYRAPSGAEITDDETLQRIRALKIPPAWANVWISPGPLGHIQATGVDRKGRLQYIYHRLWRELRDAQKFVHMLRFARTLPSLRTAAVDDLKHRGLTRERVVASVVRLIDLGLFRIGGEKYAELDHHYGATTLLKEHVRLTPEGITFDYIAKAGKHRTIVVRDELVMPIIRTLVRANHGHESLFCYQQSNGWHLLHSRDVGNYIATRAGGHFTAKEFRTWNATVLMALVLASAGPSPTERSRQRVISSGVKEVARWLGDTPAVARGSYIDPRIIRRYESDGQLTTVPAMPAELPAPAEVESAVAELLSATEPVRSLAGASPMERVLTLTAAEPARPHRVSPGTARPVREHLPRRHRARRGGGRGGRGGRPAARRRSQEAAWRTVVEVAPWLIGQAEEAVPPEDPYQKLKPFEERVARDIEMTGATSRPDPPASGWPSARPRTPPP
jgi:DNA topoisomerase I